MLDERFHGVLPETVGNLVVLPGVGRKNGEGLFGAAGKSAIGVDTHVAHISRALGWSKHIDPAKIGKRSGASCSQKTLAYGEYVVCSVRQTHLSRRKKSELLSHINAQ